MIRVQIVENMGLVALCEISGKRVEFYEDLARLKDNVDVSDREYVKEANPKYWRVRNAERYSDAVVEIGDAIKLHKMQLRMF